ncbi:MAG: thioredoxin family protein [Bacteroidota bacterium]
MPVDKRIKDKNSQDQSPQEISLNDILSTSDEGLHILVFSTSWLGAGEIYSGYVTGLAAELNLSVEPSFIDVDHQKELARFFAIEQSPTTILLFKQEILDRFVGVISRKKLRKRILDNRDMLDA